MLIAPLTGIIAGVIHCLSGPDHVAAVAPFALEGQRKGWLVGLFWGIGHTAGVWVVALVAILLREALPVEALSHWSERIVGATLIGIGLWTARKATAYRVHYHDHVHDGVRHTHVHLHRSAVDHRSVPAHVHSHAPLGIGILHGLAGSSHLLGVLPALLLPTRTASVLYVAGFGLGSVFAMVLFSWIVGKFLGRLLARFSHAYNLMLAVFACLAITVGVIWLTVA
jgi:ABC-type nickel/cobalt efflux system permease component RcnA